MSETKMKLASLRYKEYILYYKSQILVPLQENKEVLLQIIKKILLSKTAVEVEKRVSELATASIKSLSHFKEFPVIFTIIRYPSEPETLLVRGAYQLKSDQIVLAFNSSFNPFTWTGDASSLLDRLFSVLNVALDHELIHRAQNLVDGMKFGLLAFLKSKLSVKWYLRDPHELKAYGNSLAHDLAYREIYEAPENIRGLQRLRSESSFLNGLFTLLERRGVNKRMIRKILVPIVKSANKWLKYYQEHPEALRIPQQRTPMYREIRKKRASSK